MIPDSRSLSRQPERLTHLAFIDKPTDYPVQPRSASLMVDVPERLRVALHLQALGVYEIIGQDATRQADLWRIVTYRKVTDGIPGDRRQPARFAVEDA